jgi:hypothetical protein
VAFVLVLTLVAVAVCICVFAGISAQAVGTFADKMIGVVIDIP